MAEGRPNKGTGTLGPTKPKNDDKKPATTKEKK